MRGRDLSGLPQGSATLKPIAPSPFDPKTLSPRAQTELTRLAATRLLLRTAITSERVEELLNNATQDLEDAERGELRPRNRYMLACNASRTCSDSLLAAYGYQLITPATHRCVTHMEVFQLVFDRRPEARLGAAYASMMAHRSGELMYMTGDRERTILTEALTTSQDILAATCSQLGFGP